MLALLSQEPGHGVKRPYTVLTMQEEWWEAAAELGIPRRFFKNKLALMKNVLGSEIVAVIAKDGEEETASIAASMYAMNATVLEVASDD
jgi:hypothetical protein